MKLSTMICLWPFSLVASATAFAPTHAAQAYAFPLIKNRASMTMSFDKLSTFSQGPLQSLRGGILKKAPPPKTCLAGTISQAWKALWTESGDAFQRTRLFIHLSDLGFILFFAFMPELILGFVSDRIINKTIRLVYLGEIFLVFLSGLGVPGLADKPKFLATLVYSLYAVHIVRRVKDRLPTRSFRRLTIKSQQQNSSRKLLYSRILDAAIYFVGTLLFLDANNIDAGVAIRSLLTVGGISSVVIGFALKEPVTEIIQGISVLLSNKFITGDTIRHSDGTCGKVQRFEWTDVTIQGDDNSFIRVPHSQLAKPRIVNLSRMPCSQVSQEITLSNRGTKKIEQALQDIKDEIRKGCPEPLEGDHQTFLVHWTDFVKPDSVVIKIECHFRIPRLSDEYWANRQNVLIAVNRAVEKYNSY